MLKIVIVFILIFIFSQNIYSKENFHIPNKDLLVIQPEHIIDPPGWRWDSDNVITTTFKIRAVKGEMGFENIFGIPNLGYFTNSGQEYSAWNKLQGTNGWAYLNQARHGHGWFWWQPTVRWQNLKTEEKRKYLEIKIMVVNSDKKPEFPVAFSLIIPDFNYGRSVRFWLTFTHDPMIGMTHPYNQNPVAKHTIAPPLLLHRTYISIPKNLWRIQGNIAEVNVPITVEQGGIDWTNITGKEQITENQITGNQFTTPNWFSWKINHRTHLHSPTSITIQCFANNNILPPQFPASYFIRIKDKHMERYIFVQLIILGNPFSYDTTFKLSKCSNKCF